MASHTAQEYPVHHARWQRGTRYYSITLERDLFQDWVVVRVWGTIGRPNGKIRYDCVESYEGGLLAVERIETRRQQHRYERASTGEAKALEDANATARALWRRPRENRTLQIPQPAPAFPFV